jgi:hypothetical protein
MDAIHKVSCVCWRCIARVHGDWLDKLGELTKSGEWQNFATITYATHWYPWARGFPTSGTGKPNAEFASHFFAFFISHVEAQLGTRLDYVVADQYGRMRGRFHQHCLLAGEGLDDYPRRELEEWLRRRAGYSRILPFEHGAAYYVSRYIGRGIQHANWDLRIGNQKEDGNEISKCGGLVVATSAELPRGLFHQTLPHRKR